jgi:hypothetical protein
VHVIVVVNERLDDPLWPPQPRVRPHENVLSSGADETVDEVLSKSSIDLRRRSRCALPPVTAWVVDVHVTAVLVRRMTEPPETLAEVATLRTAEIANGHARRVGVGSGISAQDVEDDAKQAIGAISAICAVRRAVLHGIPREEQPSLGRKPNSVHQPPRPRSSDGLRPPPMDSLAGPGHGGSETRMSRSLGVRDGARRRSAHARLGPIQCQRPVASRDRRRHQKDHECLPIPWTISHVNSTPAPVAKFGRLRASSSICEFPSVGHENFRVDLPLRGGRKRIFVLSSRKPGPRGSVVTEVQLRH